VAVDELDAKDLRLGERDGDSDLEIGRLGVVVYLGDLLDLQRSD
jgi:hypothetical protein